MDAALTAFPLAELRRWASRPQLAPAFSPLAEDPFLLCDLKGAQSLPERDRTAIRLWLRQLAVPCIAVGSDAGQLAAGFDVSVSSMVDVGVMLPNLRRSPIAASVFVQLLRITEGMDAVDAVTAESLAYATLQTGSEFSAWLQSYRAKPAQVAGCSGDEGPPLLIDRNGDRLSIELNRPSRRNAISMEMRDALIEAFDLVDADETIRAARLSGRGRCFSIGGDLDEFGTTPDPATGHIVRNLALPARHLLRCLDRVEFHVHGACIGAGIELPAFARRVTAAPDAFFQLPELRFGLIPGAGGCVSLPRRIGRQRTAQMVLSGRRIGAAEALRCGLIDSIVRSGPVHANG